MNTLRSRWIVSRLGALARGSVGAACLLAGHANARAQRGGTAAVAERETAAASPGDASPRKGGFSFSLLPRSLQRSPQLSFNIITERTPEGARMPLPTPAAPVYYVLQAGNFQQLGSAAPAGETAPSVEYLTRMMKEALAAGGYRESEAGKPPAKLVVVFSYGSFASHTGELDRAAAESAAEQAYAAAAASGNADAAPPPPPAGFIADSDSLLPLVIGDAVARRELLARAGLIGGNAFAAELALVLNDHVEYLRSVGMSGVGSEQFGPFQRFRERNAATLHLIEEAFGSLYFVTASAYDAAGIARGERRLLWRTKMTVSSDGVSMTETLPSLIAAAGPYLGREMKEPAIVTRRLNREGKVEIGTATVVEDAAPAATELPRTTPATTSK